MISSGHLVDEGSTRGKFNAIFHMSLLSFAVRTVTNKLIGGSNQLVGLDTKHASWKFRLILNANQSIARESLTRKSKKFMSRVSLNYCPTKGKIDSVSDFKGGAPTLSLCITICLGASACSNTDILTKIMNSAVLWFTWSCFLFHLSTHSDRKANI